MGILSGVNRSVSGAAWPTVFKDNLCGMVLQAFQDFQILFPFYYGFVD